MKEKPYFKGGWKCCPKGYVSAAEYKRLTGKKPPIEKGACTFVYTRAWYQKGSGIMTKLCDAYLERGDHWGYYALYKKPE